MGWLIAVILLLTNVMTCIYLLYHRNKAKAALESMAKEMDKKEYDIEYDKKNAEIESLQSQINPHFLYNTLEVIRSEAIINKDMEAAHMAEALANYFRYNINRKRSIVTLGEELDNIQNYISIQKRRFEERISYQVIYHSDENEARQAMMPKLMLQPLVENSIYHGIEKKAQGGTVTVHITVTHQRLIAQVEDDGPGMDRHTVEMVLAMLKGADMPKGISKSRHGGIALANINRRIQMLYGENFGLTFCATKDVGTLAEVTMPYYTEEQRECNEE